MSVIDLNVHRLAAVDNAIPRILAKFAEVSRSDSRPKPTGKTSRTHEEHYTSVINEASRTRNTRNVAIVLSLASTLRHSTHTRDAGSGRREID